ncbi:hypothetical protein HBI83_222340 [Parastagonospora nodorum]|nr:hypothetical protein HBI83_222340 [Parastagonospora nodorum]
MKKSKIREPVYYLPILWDPPGAKQIPDLVGKDAANLMHAMRNAFRRLKEYVSNDMAMHADFMRHIDRQKSIVFRAGVICSSYDGSVAGITIAGTEPSRSPDLYLDYRIGIPPSNIVSHLKDPTSLDRDFIIKRIGLFASSNPDARFSVLRLWSAPHFYPLMLSIDQRATCAFLDDRGRAWEFKFVPKDMPYSEWSIHHQLSLRLEPWKKIFGLQVIVCKDLVLVMGRDKADCRLLSGGVTWAVQTKPWRLEVDFWRSFVNVDAKFLEGLDRRWLD